MVKSEINYEWDRATVTTGGMKTVWKRGDEHAAAQIAILHGIIVELEETVRALCDGINRRCGVGPSELPIVSLDRLIARDEQRIAELETAVRDITQLVESLPSGFDESADENDTSPEDMTAHIGGLIWKRALQVMENGGEP